MGYKLTRFNNMKGTLRRTNKWNILAQFLNEDKLALHESEKRRFRKLLRNVIHSLENRQTSERISSVSFISYIFCSSTCRCDKYRVIHNFLRDLYVNCN
jgi:hypothetical protein